MASAWGLSWGAAWGNSWGLLDDVVQLGGGVFGDHSQHYKLLQKQEEAERELKAKEERIIRLQQEAQELRLQQIAIEQAKEKQSQRQLVALNAEITRILDLIAQEIRYREILERKLFDLRDSEAMLVLSMAMPFHTIGRGFYMH